MPPRKPTTSSEHSEQSSLLTWAKYQRAKFPMLDLLYHVPNEGKRSTITGSKLKQVGLKRGIPDLVLPYPSGPYHALYIEMKSSSGRISKDQAEWHAKLREAGNKVEVCVGWSQAAKVITDYLLQPNSQNRIAG